MSSYYDILGIAPSASIGEIRKAYRTQALLFHPDKNKSPYALARFMMVQQAYEVLSDSAQRFAYDHKQGQYAQSIYDLPDYETWKAQRMKEEREEARREEEQWQARRKAFRETPYYGLRKSVILLKSFTGIFTGMILVLLSLYFVWRTHFIVFFVVLPFCCGGGLMTYFSYTWWKEKKKLF